MSNPVKIHASLFLSGAFEIDLDTGKMTPLMEPLMDKSAMVVPLSDGLAPGLQQAAAVLALQRLIKTFVDGEQKQVTPTMPPAEGVH